MSGVDPKLCRQFAEQWKYEIPKDMAAQLRAAAELAERVLTEERVREVVRAVVVSLDYRAPVDAIATRAAKELAGAVVGLSAEERATLEWLRSLADMGIFESLEATDPVAAEHSRHCRASVALLDRLLGGSK